MVPVEEAWRISLVKPYLPKCLEGAFCELRRCWGVLLGLPLYATHKVFYDAPVLVLILRVSHVRTLLEYNLL
jgi:hypothetical protein